MKKNYFIGLAVLAFFGALLTGCGNGTPKQQDAQAAESEAMEVDDLLAGAESLAGRDRGDRGRLCALSASMAGARSSSWAATIRRRSASMRAKKGTGKSPTETVNSLVRVTGTARRTAYRRSVPQSVGSRSQSGRRMRTRRRSRLRERSESPRRSACFEPAERLDNFRKRIAEREQAEGKAYLSFYSVTADSYEIR